MQFLYAADIASGVDPTVVDDIMSDLAIRNGLSIGVHVKRIANRDLWEKYIANNLGQVQYGVLWTPNPDSATGLPVYNLYFNMTEQLNQRNLMKRMSEDGLLFPKWSATGRSKSAGLIACLSLGQKANNY